MGVTNGWYRASLKECRFFATPCTIQQNIQNYCKESLFSLCFHYHRACVSLLPHAFVRELRFFRFSFLADTLLGFKNCRQIHVLFPSTAAPSERTQRPCHLKKREFAKNYCLVGFGVCLGVGFLNILHSVQKLEIRSHVKASKMGPFARKDRVLRWQVLSKCFQAQAAGALCSGSQQFAEPVNWAVEWEESFSSLWNALAWNLQGQRGEAFGKGLRLNRLGFQEFPKLAPEFCWFPRFRGSHSCPPSLLEVMGGWRDQRQAFSSAAFWYGPPLPRAPVAAKSCRLCEQKHLLWKVGGNWRWDRCRSPPLGCASPWTRLPEPPRQLNKKLIHGALQKYFCFTCSRWLDVSPSFLFLFAPLCLPQFSVQLASAPLLLSHFSFLSLFSLPQQLKKKKKNSFLS